MTTPCSRQRALGILAVGIRGSSRLTLALGILAGIVTLLTA
jgi:hypothetical protein